MLSKLRQAIRNDLEAPAEARTFGSGWISGVSALVLALAGLSMILSMSYPDLLSMPQLRQIYQEGSFSWLCSSYYLPDSRSHASIWYCAAARFWALAQLLLC